MNEFIDNQISIVQKEFDYECEEISILQKNYSPKALQKFGLALADLESSIAGSKLISNSFRTGDIVGFRSFMLSSKNKQNDEASNEITGIVIKVGEFKISISTENEIPTEWKDLCSIALKELKKRVTNSDGKSLSHVEEVILGNSKPATICLNDFDRSEYGNNFKLFNSGLNSSQIKAVKCSLISQDVSLIHGPPDNLAEKLIENSVRCTRVGHPARLLPSVIEHSLDYKCRNSDLGQIINELRKEIDSNLVKLRKSSSKQERNNIYAEIRSLRKDLKARESNITSKIISPNTNGGVCVLSTLNGVGSRNFNNLKFDVVVIDEAAMAFEAECWIAILKASKVILAGDHLQLTPTIKSDSQKESDLSYKKSHDTSRSNLKLNKNSDSTKKPSGDNPSIGNFVRSSLFLTMFERLKKMYGDTISNLLSEQYRMHKDIMSFSSNTLYDNKLIANEKNEEHLLCDIPGVSTTDETSVPFIFIDTLSNVEFSESYTPQFSSSEKTSGSGNSSMKILKFGSDVNSKLNNGEAELVLSHVKLLCEAGVNMSDIAVISPYNAQVYEIKQSLSQSYPEIEVGSVDGFQGREKEAVIISLVRSNPEGNVGFLSDYRRINVAITRPRRHLCIIGNSETLSMHNEFLSELCEYGSDNGELRFP
ncbi:DNA polymerase alpha-associated DNA helicase A [Smittium culicis]|uniref:DNA polymerase alpha-associated DNA helicase A n=1 Tax=Smittium culicis TaxID=133412 RepID=A0A1R1Y4V4_9FUNG|nr:DNA polymerase alpha-associated DNA helicase A [Smittium culicis]